MTMRDQNMDRMFFIIHSKSRGIYRDFAGDVKKGFNTWILLTNQNKESPFSPEIWDAQLYHR